MSRKQGQKVLGAEDFVKQYEPLARNGESAASIAAKLGVEVSSLRTRVNKYIKLGWKLTPLPTSERGGKLPSADEVNAMLAGM